MDNILIRCSQLHKILGSPRKKGELLTQTAKSYLKGQVKQDIFGYKEEIDSKYLLKGIHTEDDCIELYNELHFTDYKKNTVRLYNEFIQGECDILGQDEIIDIKSSWSKATFPATKEDAEEIIKKSGYDWQGVGYMWLYDKPKFTVAFCLIDTPDFLTEYEKNLDLHLCNDIEPELRITKVTFERDEEKEELIKQKVKQARDYIEWYELQILNKF